MPIIIIRKYIFNICFFKWLLFRRFKVFFIRFLSCFFLADLSHAKIQNTVNVLCVRKQTHGPPVHRLVAL